MPKIKNLTCDDSLVIYTDASGQAHYAGVARRKVLSPVVPDPYGRNIDRVWYSKLCAIPSRRGRG